MPRLSTRQRARMEERRRRTALSVATCVLVGVVALVSSRDASAQLVVYDGATTARNTVTATLKEYLYQTQLQQRLKIREMARRLSALTSLRKYSLEDVPRWRTHGGDFFYAQPYNDALIFGDSAGAAFVDLSQPLLSDARLLDRLDAAARRRMEARLATVNLADAAAIAGTHGTGQLRLLGRRNELQAIDALERDVIDPSSDQSTTAVLDKVSGAALIGARQRQARIQLLVGVVEQLLVDTKRARDTDMAALTMQMVTWRDGRAVNEAFVAGSGDALRTWRQP
jgi:hypothetical protein